MITFIIGLFVGSIVGVFCMALCIAAHDDSEDMHHDA